MWCRKWIWDNTKWTLICKTSFKMKNLQLFRTNNSLSNRNTLLEDYSHLCIFTPRELMNWHDLFPVKEIKLKERRAFSIFLLKDINLPNIFSCIWTLNQDIKNWLSCIKVFWGSVNFCLFVLNLWHKWDWCVSTFVTLFFIV